MWSLVPYKLVVLGQHICFGPKGLAWWEFLLRTRNYPTHIHINATINVRCFNLLLFACLYNFLLWFFCILFLKRIDIPYTGDSRYLGTSLLPILKQHSRLFDDSGMTYFIYYDFSCWPERSSFDYGVPSRSKVYVFRSISPTVAPNRVSFLSIRRIRY